MIDEQEEKPVEQKKFLWMCVILRKELTTMSNGLKITSSTKTVTRKKYKTLEKVPWNITIKDKDYGNEQAIKFVKRHVVVELKR